MLIETSDTIRRDGAYPGGDRAEKAKLIAMAIAKRAVDEPDGWALAAERVGAVVPDFHTLLHFMRRDPDLLTAFFASEPRVTLLIETSSPSARLLARYAQDLTRGSAPCIVDLTEDERQRVRLYELCLLTGAPEPVSISAAADSLALRTPGAITALAFLLLRTGRAPPNRLPLQTISAWPEHRRRIFFWRYLGFAFQQRITPFADPARMFRLTLNAREKAQVLRLQMPGQLVAAKRSGINLLCKLVQRSGVSALQWLDLSLTLPRLPYLIHVETWTRLARNVLGSNPANDYLSRPATLAAMTRRFGADGALHLYPHYGVRSLFEQSLENGARSSKKILKDFAARYPQVLPSAVLESIETFTADRDTFITLVNEYLIGRAPRGEGGIAEIVGAAFETPASVMRAIVQCETGRRLMAALSHFKTRHGVNLLRSVAFSGDAPTSPSGLDSYLYELRNAFNLELALHTARRGGKVMGKNAQRKLFEKFFALEFGADRLPPERVETARQQLRARAVGRINAVFEAQGGGQRLEHEDLDALARDWRDTEPVVTLLARLSDPTRRGGPSVDAARLVLHATKAAAQRQFMAFKFDDVGARRQLHFLSDAQREAWKASRTLARVGGGERSDDQSRLKQTTLRLQAGLDRLFARLSAEPQFVAPALRAEMAELASDEIKADPAVVAERVLRAYASPERIAACARACLIDAAARLGNVAPRGTELRNAARIMRALVRIGFAGDGDGEACQSVLADLRAIEREIPRDLLDGETISRGIVVSALDCSPRLMLTIGDVVNTGCCLNYHSGSRINVLPAYVVDANIQALVSWHLKQTHFASVRDYKTVLNAFVAGRPPRAAFDGDRVMFRFLFPDGERPLRIDTVSLGFAHLRQIVRLGRVRQRLLLRPGLLAEREYAQPHPLQPLMHANHAEILRTLTDELRAVETRPLKFPKSRNPDGVYCDALAGVQLNEYVVYQS